MSFDHERRDALDDATTRRLARLGRSPIDTTGLERRLEAALGDDGGDAEPAPPAWTRWLTPAVAVAASILLAAAILFTGLRSGPTASASVIELTGLHNDILTGRVPLEPAQSVSGVNDRIAAQRATGPEIPDELSGARVRSCCLADVRGELVAVALLDHRGAKLTLVVADAPRFAHRMGTVIERGGRSFFGHELNGVPMMMTSRDDRWLCVMGDLDDEALADVAAEVEF